LADKHKFLDPCKVEFKNIKYSRQTFDEYDEEAREYNKEEQEFITEFSPGVTSNIEYEGYSIEGFLLNPKKGWVTFDIIAEEFYCDDLKDWLWNDIVTWSLKKFTKVPDSILAWLNLWVLEKWIPLLPEFYNLTFRRIHAS